MKAKCLRWFLLFLFGFGVLDLPAQQSEADRKLLAEIRTKAEKGEVYSQLELVMTFYQGNLGVATNHVEAIKWLRKAAEQNVALAQGLLGHSYEMGRGVPTNYVEAVKWYRKAAEQNDPEAQHALGVCYSDGRGVEKDEAQAWKWFFKAAEQNHAIAQYNLGVCYSNGRGVAEDEVEAVKWFRKAAEKNVDGAQFNLAVSYINGRGVPTNCVEAVKWYRKAAEQGHGGAQCGLGFCYATGRGVAQDEVEAVKWYRKAAEQGQAKAQFNLASSYRNGRGVATNDIEATKWLRKAAEQNLAEAQYLMGVAYENSRGVATNYVEAVKWYRKAAEQNFAFAQFSLALNCTHGLGVSKDYVHGYKWALLAGAQGLEGARELIAVLEQLMTPEQIAEGQKLARGFKPREATPSGSDGSSMGIAPTRPESSGTGFFISNDGFLVSNAHVVEGATQVRLVTSTGLISAKVVKVDAANDLALLKAEGKFAALPIAASRAVKLGGTVVTVGFPNVGLQGFAPKLAKGEIASLSGAQDDARYFQISVPVQPGNSGGALVDERGNVVGVVSAKLSARAALASSGALPENVNYAIKSSYLLSFLESVPEVSAKLKEPNVKEKKFEDVVKEAKQAAVLVLVY